MCSFCEKIWNSIEDYKEGKYSWEENVYEILKYLYEDSIIYLQRKYDRYVNFKTQYEKEYLDNG